MRRYCKPQLSLKSNFLNKCMSTRRLTDEELNNRIPVLLRRISEFARVPDERGLVRSLYAYADRELGGQGVLDIERAKTEMVITGLVHLYEELLQEGRRNPDRNQLVLVTPSK